MHMFNDPGKMEIPNSYNYITADTQDPDVEEAWRELETLVGKPRGLTEWELVLRIDISYFFADSKGYQAMVAKLEVPE